MTTPTNYERVVAISRTDSEEKANDYLKLGWILLNVESLQYSEHGWRTAFVLGWDKDVDEIKHPEPTEWEQMMNVPKDEQIPF